MKLFHTFVIILIQSLSSVQFLVAPVDYSIQVPLSLGV